MSIDRLLKREGVQIVEIIIDPTTKKQMVDAAHIERLEKALAVGFTVELEFSAPKLGT